MKWITSIQLTNYRAFRAAYAAIRLKPQQHLLIYGENGSGKSSLYSAVRDFFQSSADTGKSFDVNLFSSIAGDDTGSVTLDVSEQVAGNWQPQTYTFQQPDAGSTHRVAPIRLANKVKGFLDYRRMLQTHFVQAEAGQSPNLFALVVEDLLADHQIPVLGGGVSTVPLGDVWHRIKTDLYDKDNRFNVFKTALADLPLFNTRLVDVLTKVFAEFRRIIQNYFDRKLEINISFTPLTFDAYTHQIIQSLKLEITYAGQSIPSYQTFLNEARLSALALAVYLAALKTYPPDATDLKVLYFDDVFIGLDTDNRIPLLDIIHKEFMAEGFQVFISTYDRQWFELARHWFEQKKCPVKYIELYADRDDDLATPDTPVVIDPSRSQIDRAKEHFRAKDYPAAGNYIRKACEEKLKDLLPETYRIDHTGEDITELEPLIGQLDKLYEDSNITKPQDLIDSIKTYRKALLNPSSHNDVKSPLYRREIQEAIDTYDKLCQLPELKRKQVLDAGQVLRINFPGDEYNMEIELADNLFITEYGDVKALSFVRYFIKNWEWHNESFGVKHDNTIVRLEQTHIDSSITQKRTLEQIYGGINKSTEITVPDDLPAHVQIDTRCLADFCR